MIYCAAHIRDGLKNHTRNVQVGTVTAGISYKGVDGHAGERRDIAESNRTPQEGKNRGAAGTTKGSIFVVGGGIVPASETGGRWPR